MNNSCLRCGSTRIVPGGPLLDHIGDFGIRYREVTVTVEGKPQALVFKDSLSGILTVRFCGDCGHAELSVGNFRELYEKYEKSLQQ